MSIDDKRKNITSPVRVARGTFFMSHKTIVPDGVREKFSNSLEKLTAAVDHFDKKYPDQSSEAEEKE